MITVQQIIDYLSEHISDSVPKYILIKEIYKKDPSCADYINAYNDMIQSKWYCELANEQWDDGSWGRFHSLDFKNSIKQNFGTTEAALGRSYELSLSKYDTMIANCIKLMERYVRGEETWTDIIEKHKDNGKGHLFSRPFMTAAYINIFDPENPVIKPLRDVVVETLEAAFATGCFDETFWEQKVREYYVPSIVAPGSFYGSMLLQNAICMSDTLQRQYLDFFWNAKNGIYYVSSVSPAEKQPLEDKRFSQWLRTLELLSGFSLFPDFMKDDTLQHLLNEADRLINKDVVLRNDGVRYSDSWRDKYKRKTDIILRITRILIKCNNTAV